MSTISYEAAMATLQTMFPTADPSVISMVLESNGGHMERTVENMLSMNLLPGAAGSDASANAGAAAEPGDDGGVSPTPAPAANKDSDIFRSLPDDFLRPPSYYQKHLKTKTEQQMEQDEMLAQMLQDEMFMEDLRRNPQRYGAMPQRQQHHHHHHHQQQQRQQSRPAAGRTPISPRSQQQQQQQAQQQQPQIQIQPAVSPRSQAVAAASVTPLPASPRSQSQVPLTHGHSSPSQQVLNAPSAIVHSSSAAIQPVDDAQESSFREKFAKLGDAAKKKLQSLASKFGRVNHVPPPKAYMSLPSLDDDGMDVAGGGSHFTIDDGVELEDRRFKPKKNNDDDDMKLE